MNDNMILNEDDYSQGEFILEDMNKLIRINKRRLTKMLITINHLKYETTGIRRFFNSFIIFFLRLNARKLIHELKQFDKYKSHISQEMEDFIKFHRNYKRVN